MAKDLKELKSFFENVRDDVEELKRDTLKEMAARFLSVVIPLTPVAENYSYVSRGKTYKVAGGNLKRSWVGEVGGGPEPTQGDIDRHVETLSTVGDKITVANTAEYSMFVNNGHLQTPNRYVPAIGKRLKASFVKGLHFKEKAEQIFASQMARIQADVFNRHAAQWNKK